MTPRTATAEAFPEDVRVPGKPRSFLLLQGPVSNFFDQLGRALIAGGHRVHHINLNFADQLFWRLPAVHFRGRFDEWRGFVAREMDRHEVTDLILFGDRRPYHLVAAEEARARGVAVICAELGYLRPDWLTLEYDGMSTSSRLPRDPATIARLARSLPAPDVEPRFHTSFARLAAVDVAYNVAEVLGRPFYPHYRRHAVYHPFVEYLGWVLALALRSLRRRATAAAKARLEAEAGSYFLFPLQLATDYQIRAHSPYRDLRDAVREVVASFCTSPGERRLVVVVHPLDNGLIAWRRLVADAAARCGAGERVLVLDGGTPPGLMSNAAGVVVVNSTVGITALRLGVPVKVLGNAVFDIPGLTCQCPLDAFWQNPPPPDRQLVDDFLRVVAAATQIRGGLYEPKAQQHAAVAMVERLEQGIFPLPPLSPVELARRVLQPVGSTVAITGASSGLGLALARAYAAPGVRLCLIGHSAAGLARAAQDCRLRGAIVETAQVDGDDRSAAVERLRAFDRRAPIDLLFANAEGAGDAEAERLIEPAWLRRRGVEADLLGAMALIEPLAEAMRRRRRGRIVVVDPLAVLASPTEIPAYHACRAGLVAYGRSLRRRLRASEVGVSVVAPGTLATRLFAGRRRPHGWLLDPEVFAARVRRGVDRGRGMIGFPSPLAVALYAAAAIPALIGDWLKGTLLAGVDPIAEADEPAALPRESSTSD